MVCFTMFNFVVIFTFASYMTEGTEHWQVLDKDSDEFKEILDFWNTRHGENQDVFEIFQVLKNRDIDDVARASAEYVEKECGKFSRSWMFHGTGHSKRLPIDQRFVHG